MNHILNLINEMITFFAGDIKRINHFIKVYSFAKLIAELEHVDSDTLNVIEVAAVTHDIGIKICEQKYNTCSGKYQEIMGPPVAKKFLSDLGYDQQLIDRVCHLIAHHHTYDNITDLDYQILIEADFLVNINEENYSHDAILSVQKKIFKTKTGLDYLNKLYLLNQN